VFFRECCQEDKRPKQRFTITIGWH